MNTIISLYIIALLSFNTAHAGEEKKTEPKPTEIKKACVEEKQKDGKTKQVCKNIKVHNKLEGTQVPNQKK